MGGLGNQMFQYAFGRSMALETDQELFLDRTLLRDKSLPHELITHREFELSIFPDLKYDWAAEKDVFLYNGSPESGYFKKGVRKFINLARPKALCIQKDNSVDPDYLIPRQNVCYVGRWQSYRFFEKHERIIRKDFNLPQPNIKGIETLLSAIKSCESVCVHVRRGDLVSSELYRRTIGALPDSYYEQAIKYIRTTLVKPKLFIFSDDMAWCKENIKPGLEHDFVEDTLAGEHAVGHFYLMRQCKHFVISNSTFAWWAAFLSEHDKKKVIYPDRWYKDESLNNLSMSPDNWISM
jgi:hypothetical protein